MKKINFQSRWTHAKMHTGHYRIYDYDIQKKECNYNSDYADIYYEDNTGEDFGINKTYWNVHDTECFDEFKEGS